MPLPDEQIQDVLDELAPLAPTGADAPRPAGQALAHLKSNLATQPQKSKFWSWKTMEKRKYAFATLILLVVLMIAFAFPGVRAAASDFLGLFRVEKFAAISISAEQIALLEEIANTGLVPGEIEMFQEPGHPVLVGSIAEANLDWEARVPADLGEPDAVYYVEGGSGQLTIDVANARAILEMAGADPGLIPDSLDGAPVKVTVYPGISLNWNEGIVLMQTLSPLIEYPQDVDPAALGQALLELLGMEADEAAELAAEIEWTNTLLLPIPENAASFARVDVDGAAGLALSTPDGQNSGIIWQKGGIVYALSGSGTDSLLDIARSLP